MKVYLAHNYAARGWLKQVVPMFEAAGHEVTSRWIKDVKNVDTEDALIDLEDIQSANVLVLFTDQFGVTPGKGKFLEMGYMLGLQQFYKQVHIILVGKDTTSCIFYALADAKVKSVEDVIVYLQEVRR